MTNDSLNYSSSSNQFDNGNASTQSFSLEDQKNFFIDVIKDQHDRFWVMPDHYLKLIKSANSLQLQQWMLEFSKNKNLKEILGRIPNEKADIFVQLLKEKFNDKVTANHIEKIYDADKEQVLEWQQRFFLDKSLRQIFKQEIDYGSCFLILIMMLAMMLLLYRYLTNPLETVLSVMFCLFLTIPLGLASILVVKLLEKMYEE